MGSDAVEIQNGFGIKAKMQIWQEEFLRRQGVNFTNILRAAFAPISFHQKKSNLSLSTEMLLKRLSYEKGERKILVKSTPSCNPLWEPKIGRLEIKFFFKRNYDPRIPKTTFF